MRSFMPAPRKPVGRPTKYDPAFCAQVVAMGEQGMGKAEMAAALGVAYSNFDTWQKVHPEFQEAVKEATHASQAWWEKQGRLATFGKIEGFNATSYIFQMKNRFRADWRDRHDHEVSGAGGGAIQNAVRVVLVPQKEVAAVSQSRLPAQETSEDEL
jgi:hypothetical protein